MRHVVFHLPLICAACSGTFIPDVFEPPVELYGDPAYASCSSTQTSDGSNVLERSWDAEGRLVEERGYFQGQPSWTRTLTRDMNARTLVDVMDGTERTRTWTADHQLARDQSTGEPHHPNYEAEFDDNGHRIMAVEEEAGNVTRWTWTRGTDGKLTHLRELGWRGDATETYGYRKGRLVHIDRDLDHREGQPDLTTTYAWEDDRLVEEVHWVGAYDLSTDTGGVAEVEETIDTTRYTYDASGREIRRNNGPNTTETTYTSTGLIESVTRFTNGTVTGVTVWSYDNAGRMIARVDGATRVDVAYVDCSTPG